MTTNLAAIVDPYSSGALLVSEFKKRGYECLMVQSSVEIPAAYQSSLNPDDYIAIIQHEGNLDETIAQLQQWDVQFVIPGCELGVELADQLSEGLGLLSNGTKLSAARRNKRLMIEAVGKHGLRTPAQLCSNRLDELLDWIHNDSAWPVVLKPLSSSGSEGVSLCASDSEVRVAFENIMNQTNMYGQINKAVLAQEFLSGTEYIVDTVGHAGQHKVAAFWKYGKSATDGATRGNTTIELLPYSEELHHRLFPYVANVLDALEIQYGPTHCEVMWVDEAPILVEIGARLNGGNNPLIHHDCGGEYQVGMTVEAYLTPDHFLDNLNRPYALPKRGMRVFLMPQQKGQLQDLPRLAEIERLQSFHQLYIGAKRGKPVSRIIGWVILIHPDEAILNSDLEYIRYLEKDGLYAIAALPQEA